MGSFVQFPYLVLNYVPFMLKMVRFMHLYCQRKLYIKMYFAAEILQYAFSKTGVSFGLLPQNYGILLDLC